MMIMVEMVCKTWEAVAAKLNLPEAVVKEDAKKLLLDMYVDDSTTGGSKEDVDRMQGSLLANGQFSGTCSSQNQYLNKDGEVCSFCGAQTGE